jgi:polar amino acid transport system substrate-binding protein
MMRFALPLLAALVVPVLSHAEGSNATAPGPQTSITVRIATEGAFPPYNSLDSAGRPQGFEIDLGNAACAHLGWRCSWVLRDWNALLPGLVAGEFEIIMAGMAITPSRRAQAGFSREYFPSISKPQGIFVGTHTFQNPKESLIAVQDGTIHEDHLRSQGYRVATYATAGAALDAVMDGTCDLTFGSPDFLEQRVFRTSRTLTIIGTQEIDAGGAAAAIAKPRADLQQGFNAALDALETDGTIERLRKKWFTMSTDT